jgi:hypothetical protein
MTKAPGFAGGYLLRCAIVEIGDRTITPDIRFQPSVNQTWLNVVEATPSALLLEKVLQRPE